MRASEHLIVKWSPALLKMELDRWFWKGQDHVSVKKVWDALCAYWFLPRLRDQAVFVGAIQDGIASGDYFWLRNQPICRRSVRGLETWHAGSRDLRRCSERARQSGHSPGAN